MINGVYSLVKEHVKTFWEEYWKSQAKPQPKLMDAFQFGADADWLAQVSC